MKESGNIVNPQSILEKKAQVSTMQNRGEEKNLGKKTNMYRGKGNTIRLEQDVWGGGERGFA